MLCFMLDNHSNGAGAHFGRKLVRRLACHRPYFSQVGVSGKPGAVHLAAAMNILTPPEFDAACQQNVGL
jgi:hypothetical protein